MSNKEKLQIVLEEIKKIYPNKIILNGTQTARVIGISSRQFTRLVTNKDYEKLPNFKSEEINRVDGTKSYKYQFKIFDIAEFLVKE